MSAMIVLWNHYRSRKFGLRGGASCCRVNGFQTSKEENSFDWRAASPLQRLARRLQTPRSRRGEHSKNFQLYASQETQK
jgi:hypothetical protein